MTRAQENLSRQEPRIRRLILDVDTGVDDALAICLACRSPGAKVDLISTVAGNTSLKNATANTLLVLDRLGLADPLPAVARGASAPLERELFCAPEVHGEDGLGGASRLYPPSKLSTLAEPAWEAVREAATRAPGELTLVATGPLTNVARLIKEAPEAAGCLESVVIMGGAIEERGNVTGHAEFNIYVDPEAADAVLSSGLPITLVPLDVTHRVVLERSELASWRSLARAEAATLLDFIAAFSDLTMTFHGLRCGIDGLYLHDPLAVAVALEPSLVVLRQARLRVDASEAFRGKVNARWDEGAPSAVATAVDSEKFLSIFRQALLGR